MMSRISIKQFDVVAKPHAGEPRWLLAMKFIPNTRSWHQAI